MDHLTRDLLALGVSVFAAAYLIHRALDAWLFGADICTCPASLRGLGQHSVACPLHGKEKES